MSLRYGLESVSIPGPSVLPERVRTAMARPMPNIYGGELLDVSREVLAALPALALTEHHAFVTAGNGHAGWQMAICNTMSAGDKVLVLESGRFAVMWGLNAATSGVEVEILEGQVGYAVDPAALQRRLEADTNHELKAILTVHVDTGSSVVNDISGLRRAIDAAKHPAMLMVDSIASLGCVPYKMDEWGVDITVAATQKGLMVPPGLGLVWASPKAIEAYETAGLRVGYFDWEPRMADGPIYSHYAGTPPIVHLYGLQAALELIEQEGGLAAVWHRHHVLASGIRAAVEAWSTPGGLGFYVAVPEQRADSVTTITTGSMNSPEFREICETQAGLTLGIGVGELSDSTFRIGHMGHLNPPMVLGTLGTIEAALHKVRAPMGGSGVAAAAELLGGHF